MEQLLQTFETPFTANDGTLYDVHLYGRSRPADTWQGWLVFVRRGDGRTLSTPVETTQPSAEAIVYWATGLTGTYIDGAFARAHRGDKRSAAAELRDKNADGAKRGL